MYLYTFVTRIRYTAWYKLIRDQQYHQSWCALCTERTRPSSAIYRWPSHFQGHPIAGQVCRIVVKCTYINASSRGIPYPRGSLTTKKHLNEQKLSLTRQNFVTFCCSKIHIHTYVLYVCMYMYTYVGTLNLIIVVVSPWKISDMKKLTTFETYVAYISRHQ